MNENESPGQRARRLLEGATPGPWRVVYGTDVTHLQVPDAEVSDADDWRIAACETPESPGGCARNAALMAAAPDLARDLIAAEERVAALQAQAADLAPQPIHPEILRLARAVASPGAEDMVDHMTADDLETLVDVVLGRLQERDRWRSAALNATDYDADSGFDEYCDLAFLVAGRER